MSSVNVQQYQSLPQGFGSGNGGTQQGQVGHMQQPAQQQQQAFMLHQHQMHNQRLIDEGLLHGMQGQGAGKNLQESAANAPTHGTPPTTGWGEPPIPSSHAPNNWGAANIGPNGAHNNISAGPETPPSMHPGAGGGPTGPPPHVLSDGMGGSIKDANWGNPNLYSAPPPSHFSAVHGGGGNSGMPYESNRGRGGRGGHHGGSFGRTAGSGTTREPYNRDLAVADSNIGTHQSDRGAFGNRSRGTINRGGRGGRGGGSYGGPPLDHSQEKNAGRKSAIAETIAMMNKMKMEDQEKKVTAKKWDEERRERNKEDPPLKVNHDDNKHELDGLSDEPLHRRNQRERENRTRGASSRGGTTNTAVGPRGAGRGGMTHGGAGGGNMFIPPGAGAGGGIPPFPGLDNFLPPGAGPVAVAPTFGGHPGGFPGGYPGGPHVPGGHPANLYHLGPGPLNFGPGGPHPAMAGPYGGRGGPGFPPRGGRGGPMGFGRGFPGPTGPMIGIRGPMGGGTRGRGSYNRGGARGGNNSISSKSAEIPKNEVEETGNKEKDEEKSGNPGDDQYDLDDPAIVGASVTQGNADADDEKTEEPPKNLNSGQGNKGQLALLASETHKEKLGARNVKSTNPVHCGKSSKIISDAIVNLRERLIRQLVGGEAECMVCLDKIKPKNATWDCHQCYQVFHIHCIKKWGKSQEDEGLRCPGCQKIWPRPKAYRCFCRKLLDPAYNRNDTPHSCGEVCGKALKLKNYSYTAEKVTTEALDCPHKCLELCHPGPCPPCTASVIRTCPCGKSKQTGRCGKTPFCDNVCDKTLNCGVHSCAKVCHSGECGNCQIQIAQTCYCDKQMMRTITCDDQLGKAKAMFSCGNICMHRLNCKNHECRDICHPGNCEECPSDPSIVKFCPCGKSDIDTLLANVRTSCLDVIPSCQNRCEKRLKCGTPSDKHICTEFCHLGDCPPCQLISKVNYLNIGSNS